MFDEDLRKRSHDSFWGTPGESHTLECCREVPIIPCAMGAEIITDVGSIVKDFTQEMTATGPTTISEHGPGTEDS